MIDWIGWSVAVPLAGGGAAFLAGGRRLPRLLGLAAGAGTLAAVAGLVLAVREHGPLRYPVGGWGAPLGIELRADGSGVALLLATAVIGAAVCVYAPGYLAGGGDADGAAADRGFWPLFLFLWAALNTLFLSSDAFNLYVGLELMTLASVGLVILSGEDAALAAAMRYLLAALLGSLAYLLGVALLYAAYHTLDLGLLAERVAPGAAAYTALALVTVGLAVKAALFPFHFWLPPAHSLAPAPVSAALSALVVSAAAFVLLRLWVGVFPGVSAGAGAQLAGALGGAAIVWGSLQAIRQQRLKLMVAYSTVAQVGYLFLVLPLAAGAPPGSPWAAQAWGGGVYHLVSHALAKAALFLAAGTIAMSLGDDRIAGVRGIAGRHPVTAYAFGIAGMSLVGVPPTGGFVAKWLLLSAAIGTGQWWWAVLILAGGVLTAGYVFQVLTQELSEAEGDHRASFTPIPRGMEYAAMALALASLLLGVRAVEPLDLVLSGAPAAVVEGAR